MRFSCPAITVSSVVELENSDYDETRAPRARITLMNLQPLIPSLRTCEEINLVQEINLNVFRNTNFQSLQSIFQPRF